jgi:hypothetical protein
MGWTVSKTFDRDVVVVISDGFGIKGVVQMGAGSAAGVVTDHS